VERTEQLKVEKNKSDRLLRQMLPITVIQQLKQQRQVRGFILKNNNDALETKIVKFDSSLEKEISYFA
jgi:hypothetical protein